ncbi:glycosyltransferase [Leptospira licerasiae]|uniref:Glycosyl transferase family 1 domain-containing protein n=1 Tax=Leptospira licerasiae str. MMD4847 TaxID=1049971 RepID=A0ABP2R884_9LEPT|nr:glycosyltransferase [Leptospira licerasiae]EIE02350.1 hypothetical protein LEP1GSC185_2126 [Leptospira licerasiae serovar Varillal str. VAR 010]EJZ40497.1 hypothetical protein LEP1GSC178_1397 [Leptospira licerasiae str. MMD4847]
MTIELISPKNSLGITRYCKDFESIFKSKGINVKLLQKPSSPDSFAHFHIGNSGRELLGFAFRHREKAIVTMHDVVPRQPVLRFFTKHMQLFFLRKHKLVVHSEYAKRLATRIGYDKPIEVIPMGPHPLDSSLDVEKYISIKMERAANFKTEEREKKTLLRLCQPGVAKKAKALPELVKALSKYPQITLVIAGGVKDKKTRNFIQKFKGSNLIVLGYCNDDVLNDEILKSDYVTCFRTDSVGEANGPLILSHYLGIPVVGWSLGSIPEYALPGDRLFSEGTSIEEILGILLHDHTFPEVKPEFLRNRVLEYWDTTFEKYKNMYFELGWISV